MNLQSLPHHIAKLAQQCGFLDERKYRDFCIKEDFNKLKKEGMTIEKIEIELSEHYSSAKYPITPESIHFIAYRRKG